MAINPLLSRYDFSGFETIADIGGGEGFLLIKILEKHSGLKGLLFDLPENKQKAEDFIKSSAMSSRISFIPGSFLELFSLEADLFIMKNVLHNWDDATGSLILGNLRKTMPPQSRLLILEMVVPGPGKDSFSKLIDIQMLSTMPGGRERTRQEFEELLEKSGFSLRRIIPTIAPLSILETVGE